MGVAHNEEVSCTCAFLEFGWNSIAVLLVGEAVEHIYSAYYTACDVAVGEGRERFTEVRVVAAAFIFDFFD